MAKLTRIAPELPAANLDNALAYYEKKLGFTVVSRLPENDYAIVERDGLAIHLYTNQATKSAAVGLHIFTPDLDQLFAELQAAGATITRKSSESPGAIATSESATNSATNSSSPNRSRMTNISRSQASDPAQPSPTASPRHAP